MSAVEKDQPRSQLEAADRLEAIELCHVVDEREGKCRIYHPDEIDQDDGAWLEGDCFVATGDLR